MGRNRGKKETKLVDASSALGKEKIAEIVGEMKSKGELPETHIAEERETVTMVRVTPVCWGIPFDEVVFSAWARHMLSSNRLMPWDDIVVSGSTYLPEARNKIHADYLEYSKSEYLFMLDSDVLPPPGTVEKLLKHMQHRKDVRMVGGWYRKKDGMQTPVVYHDDFIDDDGIWQYRKYGNNEVGEGLEKVDAAGAGCWLMHRSVAEAIGPRPYDMNQGGEDLLLCRKVKAAGYSLWIDWDIACAHAGVAVA